MKHKKTTIFGMSLLILLLPALLKAQVCGTGKDIVPDGRSETDIVFAGSVHHYQFVSIPGHSYSIEENPGFSWAFGTIPMSMAYSVNGIPVNPCYRFSPTDTSTMDPPVVSLNTAVPQRQRLAFIDTTAIDTTFEINNSGSSDFSFNISVIDTTLFTPGWSTYGAANTYWSFTNTSNAPITVLFRLSDTSGAIVGSRSATINAGATFSTNTVDLEVARERNGSATLAHDGPPGAIAATAVINAGGANPQYVPFAPRPQ